MSDHRAVFEAHFAEHMNTRVEAGSVLHHAGSVSERVRFLRSGIVLEVSRDPSGAETILGLVGPGEIVDLATAVDGRPHHSDSIAATPCHVISSDAASFRDALRHDARLCSAVALGLAQRVRWIGDAAHERGSQAVAGRVAGRLLDLAVMLGRAQGDAIEVEMPIDQSALARLAGTSRESTCKTLRHFRREGVVDYRGRRLRILRPEALGRIRCRGRVRP